MFGFMAFARPLALFFGLSLHPLVRFHDGLSQYCSNGSWPIIAFQSKKMLYFEYVAKAIFIRICWPHGPIASDVYDWEVDTKQSKVATISIHTFITVGLIVMCWPHTIHISTVVFNLVQFASSQQRASSFGSFENVSPWVSEIVAL